METNFPGIYAAGDCAEAFHLVSGQSIYFPLGTVANRQGRTAGMNVAGEHERFQGITGTMITGLFNLNIARTGLSESAAIKAGFRVKTSSIQHHNRAAYMPDASLMSVKVIADAVSGRLLGLEMAGQDIGKRIDVGATALFNRMSVKDILHLDVGYAPPLAAAWDPLIVAVNQLVKK